MKRSRLKRRSKSKVTIDIADKSLQNWFRKTYPKGKCEVCNRPFFCMHHFIPKSQSNFLRFAETNLIFICNSCHFSHHRTGNAKIHAKIIIKRGVLWLKKIMKLSIIKRQAFSKKELEQIIKRYE